MLVERKIGNNNSTESTISRSSSRVTQTFTNQIWSRASNLATSSHEPTIGESGLVFEVKTELSSKLTRLVGFVLLQLLASCSAGTLRVGLVAVLPAVDSLDFASPRGQFAGLTAFVRLFGANWLLWLLFLRFD